MDLVWRPVTLGDCPALAGLNAVVAEHDRTGVFFDAAELRALLTSPTVDLAASTVAWRGAEPVAFALVRRRDAAEDVHMMRSEVLVHPDHRDEDVAAYLLAWFAATARRVHERSFPGTRPELHIERHEHETWLIDVLKRAGYVRGRTMLKMRARLGELPPPAPFPSGLEPVRFEERYDALVLDARNDTFAEHWGSTSMELEAWRHTVTAAANFRPDLTFLLLSPAGDRVDSFVISYFSEYEASVTGVRELYVGLVGTRSSLRGQGAATALVGHTLRQAKAAGLEVAMLGVDGDHNPGAVGVYGKCGFHREKEEITYVLSLG